MEQSSEKTVSVQIHKDKYHSLGISYLPFLVDCVFPTFFSLLNLETAADQFSSQSVTYSVEEGNQQILKIFLKQIILCETLMFSLY